MENNLSHQNSFRALAKVYLLVALALLLLTTLFFVGAQFIGKEQTAASVSTDILTFITGDFLIYLLVGFTAQMIDGALGMAYGVSSTSFLLSVGLSPATASASVHLAEVFTTGISGLSHWRFGNVNKKLFLKLALPGVLGAVLGAYAISSFDGDAIKPFIAIYLLVMGVVIIAKATRKMLQFKEVKRVRLLALFGGFADASGGGGWGPVVTTTLLGSGLKPKLTIGTVNAVEFLVALAASSVFTMFIQMNNWPVIVGLIVGGALAAPLGAYVCHIINARIAMWFVGLLIIFLSLRTLAITFNLI